MLESSNAFLITVIGVAGTIFVALISGVFSLVGFIISKEQKLSDFRQAWIDALREDISAFTSCAIMINAYAQMFMRPANERYEADQLHAGGDPSRLDALKEAYLKKVGEYFQATYKDYSELNACSTRIKLRLNDSPHEIDSNMLLKEMAKLEAIFAANLTKIDGAAVQNTVAEIEKVSRPLLKKEWDRVKRGERTFLVAKWVSICSSGVFLIALLLILACTPAYFIGYFSGPNREPVHCHHTVNRCAPACQDITCFEGKQSPLPPPAK